MVAERWWWCVAVAAATVDGVDGGDEEQWWCGSVGGVEMEIKVKWLKQSRIPIVKVRWNSRRGPEFTWEREDQMKKRYPHLFTNSTPASKDSLNSADISSY
ncbi:hypothetical protein Tco_0796093 [Tanacetum coccineum]